MRIHLIPSTLHSPFSIYQCPRSILLVSVFLLELVGRYLHLICDLCIIYCTRVYLLSKITNAVSLGIHMKRNVDTLNLIPFFCAESCYWTASLFFIALFCFFIFDLFFVCLKMKHIFARLLMQLLLHLSPGLQF